MVHLVYLSVTLHLKRLLAVRSALVYDDDIIEIDIPNRSINLKISDEELANAVPSKMPKAGNQLTVNVKCHSP